jgi:hypothetical protein
MLKVKLQNNWFAAPFGEPHRLYRNRDGAAEITHEFPEEYYSILPSTATVIESQDARKVGMVGETIKTINTKTDENKLSAIEKARESLKKADEIKADANDKDDSAPKTLKDLKNFK